MTTDDLDRPDTDELGRYVPAVFARSTGEAEQYAELLLDHDIPSVVDEDYQSDPPETEGAAEGKISVLVPESLREDARDIIAEFDEMAPFVDEDDQPAGQGFDDEDDDYSSLSVSGEDTVLEEEEGVQPVSGTDRQEEEDDERF